MVEEKLQIGDFQTTDLLYHDPDYTKEGYQFCEKRDIDCLPIIGDSEHYYWRDKEKGRLVCRQVEEERRLGAGTDAFLPALRERFRRFPVQFVYCDGNLAGIVHFSDYNREIVSHSLYGELAQYERDLRALARCHKLNNSHMQEYFDDMLKKASDTGNESSRYYFKRKLARCQRPELQSTKLPMFDIFYLDDLLGLLKHKGVMKLNGSVTDLRNAIMHVRELVHMKDVTTPDFIYDYNSFALRFRSVLLLLKDSQRVRNRLKYLDPNWFPEQEG